MNLFAPSSRVGLLLLLIVFCQPAFGAQKQPLEHRSYTGVALKEVLGDYEEAGYDFVYSRRVIRAGRRIKKDPPTGEPIERLQHMLQTLRIELRATDIPGRYLLVRLPRKRLLLLKGQVSDAHSKAPLSAVRVVAGDRSTSTDARGQFEISAAPRQTLRFEHPGYQGTIRSGSAIEVEALTVEMLARMPTVEEVLVTSSRYALKRSEQRLPATYQLRDNELDALPEVGDDALRAALHLPGMATVGLSAQPHVRGGLRDETLILFDGVELLEPFHLKDFQSLFSGLNPSLIKTIDVYTGAFPARYGDRLSGVMDIQPVTDFLEAGGEFSISLLTTGLSVHGPFAGGQGDWVLSSRRGNLDLVTEWINPSVGDPAYSDHFGQFTYAFDATSEISGTLIYFDDDILLRDGDLAEEDGESAVSRYQNLYGWLKWGKRWRRNFDSSTVLSIGRIRHRREGQIVAEDEEDSDAFARDRRRFQLYSLRHRTVLESTSGLAFEMGGVLNYSKGQYNYSSAVTHGDLAEILDLPSQVEYDFDLHVDGFDGGIYTSTISNLTDRVAFEAGLRWDFQDYANISANHVSPRASLRFDWTDNTRVRLSVGRFYQPEALHELQIVDGFSEYQPAQRSDHYIAAVEHRFGDSGFQLRAEAFSKLISSPKRRFENLFDSLVLLPELGADRFLVVAKRARARGIEATLGYTRDAFSGSLSYTWSRAEDSLADRWVRRSWDQRHTIAGGLFWTSDTWSLAVSGLWHSGWPRTQLPGVISADDPLRLARNEASLQNYFSLDARVGRRWQRGRHEFEVFGEITNALNRRNVGSVELELEELPDESGYSAIQEPVRVLPWVPSVGFRWKF